MTLPSPVVHGIYLEVEGGVEGVWWGRGEGEWGDEGVGFKGGGKGGGQWILGHDWC